MHINLYIPLPVVYIIVAALCIVVWVGIGIAIGNVLEKISRRRTGDTLLENKYLFWVNLALTGPVGWFVTLTNMEAVKRGRQRGRERRAYRSQTQTA